MNETRPPAVAGRFYPGQKPDLAREVAALMAARTSPDPGAPPKAIIAPHAGYAYSGGAAAAAFSTLAHARGIIERVVLLAPAHTMPLQGIAAPAAKAFETPLGTMPVDRDALARARQLPFVVESEAAHASEHAIEVELPFLQAVLGPVRLAPFVVGGARAEDVAELLHLLWGGEETLIVISSDLSHYHPYDEAKRLDTETAAHIEAFEGATLTVENACGYLGIQGLLIEARHRGMRIERLALVNSGDTAGDRRAVVGYGAWALW